MSDQPLTFAVLERFHREIILPDIERVVAGLVNHRFDAIDGHFDSIYQRFIRIEDEYQAIGAALGRLELVENVAGAIARRDHLNRKVGRQVGEALRQLAP